MIYGEDYGTMDASVRFCWPGKWSRSLNSKRVGKNEINSAKRDEASDWVKLSFDWDILPLFNSRRFFSRKIPDSGFALAASPPPISPVIPQTFSSAV
jgi:hypothetical protein